MDQFDVPSNVQDAFKAFTSDNSLLALPLSLQSATLQTSRAIQCKDAGHTSQISLSILEDVLSPTRSLYVMLRRNDSIFAITFVPYRAAQDERNSYLQYRYDLVKLLGQEHFESSFICKEIGEITDARSWTEREQGQGEAPDPDHVDACCDPQQSDGGGVEDFGYKKNKCRLCDRRMKNKITDEALAALRKLEDEKTLVQMSLDADLVLALDLQTTSVQPDDVSSHLPITDPTFTLYHHPNKRLYFIFHSPDSATVQQRMKHTMAIPGLVNVHAEDCGVHIDQKIEIHEPDDLAFEDDEKIGKFRSMYLRGGWQGTESQYDGLERDLEFYNTVR